MSEILAGVGGVGGIVIRGRKAGQSLILGKIGSQRCLVSRGNEDQKYMQMNTIVKSLCHHLMVGLLVMLGAVVQGGCGERENMLMIEKPTEVYAITPLSPSTDSGSGIQPGSVIATLKAGETAQAVGVYHGQDQDGFKVKLVDGREGLIFAGDTYKVVTR